MKQSVKASMRSTVWRSMRKCVVRQLGRMDYGTAFALQQRLVAERKQGSVTAHHMLLYQPHLITLERNGRQENLVPSEELLDPPGIAFHPTDRGGDVTYHGPGQLVGYPILDLCEWKRDVGAYV